MQSSSITTGWLIKQGGSKGGFKTWKKRWFVLSQSELMYYSQPSRKELKGSMIITDCVVAHVPPLQAGFPYCISVRTVERELLLRCSSDAEAEAWRKAITGKSSAPLAERSDASAPDSGPHTHTPLLSSSAPAASDSVVAEDGDSLDLTGISIGHRFMTESAASSTKSSVTSNSGGAIPGWDGKKNPIGFIRIPGTSTMFWDLEQSCAIFLPTLWIYPHITCVRFPDYLEMGRHKEVQQALLRYGDTSILFSDLVYKFNRSNKMQQRVLIITDQALYVLNDVKLSICRRISLQELGGVSYSSIGDDYVVVHVPSHYDYLLSCSRKKELTDQLQLAYRQKLGRSVCVRVYGDDHALSGSLWMRSVWDPNGRSTASERDRIINGTNHIGLRKTMSTFKQKKMFLFGKKALHDPLYAIQSDQLLALLLTPHHPLGKHFVDFIDQFNRRFDTSSHSRALGTRVTLGDDPRIVVQEMSMTNAISVIRDFFAKKMTGVSELLKELKFQLSDGHVSDALQSAIFPAIASTIMPLVHQQNAEVDQLILKTGAVIKEAQLAALDYLKLGPKLLQVLMQGISNSGIFSNGSSLPDIDTVMPFEIPADCLPMPFWPVYTMLGRLGEASTPMKKVVLLNASIALISSCVSLYSANAITLNGDDLLPLLVYCISMSNLKHPMSEMNFVAEFVEMGQPSSEQMYCMNLFEIALALMQQLHRDLPEIARHVLSASDIASAVANCARRATGDYDSDDEEEPLVASSSIEK